jgi:hypothetical protein
VQNSTCSRAQHTAAKRQQHVCVASRRAVVMRRDLTASHAPCDGCWVHKAQLGAQAAGRQ